MRCVCTRRDLGARRWLVSFCSAMIVAPAMLSAQQATAGDTLHIRLLDRIRSHHRARPSVHAVVIAPLSGADGRTVLPPGTLLSGRVTGGGMERYNGKRHWL